MSRDHYVAGQAPDWSRRGNGFRHLDGTSADWRERPTMAPRRAPRSTDEPANWRDAFVFLCGNAWGIILTVLVVQTAHLLGCR